MCLIVDANCGSMAFRDPPDDDFKPITDSLFLANAKLIVGGSKLMDEYRRIGSAMRALAILDKAGKVRWQDNKAVDKEQENLTNSGICKSDDEHIVALARLSGVRLICTRDKALHQDLGNKSLIGHPSVSIYQDRSHALLLRKHCK